MIIRPRYPRIVTAKRKYPEGIVQVPAQLRLKHPFRYPLSNITEFERWYYESFTTNDVRDRLYLPIFWTSYYCSHKFGLEPRAVKHLQSFLNGLDKSKKYYTICQYDDGPDNKGVINLEGLDLKVFGMAGGRNDFPIPLICQPHLFKDKVERDLKASFVGRVTHDFRGDMMKQILGMKNTYISTKDHKMDDYCRIMARSVFALCPRGYSATSFRISEAVQQGAIPVYISDEHIMPYNKPFDYGLVISPQDDLRKVLSEVPKPMIDVLQQNIEKVKPLFYYPGCKKIILEELQNEADGN